MADEKYQLTLEGDQIDDALLQMYLRAPEGWTKGTRDGVPVGNTSEYFQNNAEWFAQQAADAAARAEAAVPAGTAGAVFFDRAQTLTDAQAMQARANIVAGGSNRNLLDNPWFTVNQRGETSGQTGSNNGIYWLDRWLIASNAGYASYSISNGTVTLTPASTGTAYISQKFENHAELVGKTLTASVMFDNGTIESGTIVRADGVRQSFFTTAYGIDVFINSANMFRISVSPSYTLAIKAVKLELGSISTLANDIAPNYAEELAKCQRYFIAITASNNWHPMGFGLATNGTTAYISLPIPVAMRAGTITVTVPNITNLNLTGGGSINIALTSIAYRAISENAVSLTITTSGLTQGEAYVLYSKAASTTIQISADL